MIRVLVSPSNVEEALECIRGEASIVDVKNPNEGSLGANFPWVIGEIVNITKSHGKEVSATVGDLDKAGTASLASFGIANLGVDYIKVGLFVSRIEKALEILRSVVRAVEDFDVKVVGACYADWKRAKTIDPLTLPEIASDADADGVMIDTAVKDGTSTFDFMSFEDISKFIDSAHENGLFCAIAGGLSWEHIEAIRRLKPDIIGVRTMVCENGRNSKINGELVRKLVNEINR